MDNFDLDTKLLKLGEYQWTARQAVEGVQIFGGIGSGKTSGSGRTLALKYLEAGFGGLVLTVKPDEREVWEKYFELTGRTKDRIIVSPDNQNFFNFLEYEAGAQQAGISATTNIAQVLKTVLRSNEERQSGRSDDSFWQASLDMLLYNAIDLCLLAYEKVSVRMLYDITQSFPRQEVNNEGGAFEIAMELAIKNVNKKRNEWLPTLDWETAAALRKGDQSGYDDAFCEAVPEARTLRLIDQFIGSMLTMGEKTRTIIEFSLSGFLYGLLREPIYSLFCKESNFKPEDCRKGKIILIDLPVKLYQKAGRDCQILFKYIWQRAMEKGPIDKGTLPVFLWADEAQNFLHEYDPEYQATARSSRIATVYLSQNLPNYHANMGGAKSDFKVKSFLGTLATKIFHANADIETNRYAAELIGDAFYQEWNKSQGLSSGKSSLNRTDSQKLDKAIRPDEFSLLKTGGDLNDSKVTAYMHIQGDLLKVTNHIFMQFDQEFSPRNKNEST